MPFKKITKGEYKGKYRQIRTGEIWTLAQIAAYHIAKKLNERKRNSKT